MLDVGGFKSNRAVLTKDKKSALSKKEKKSNYKSYSATWPRVKSIKKKLFISTQQAFLLISRVSGGLLALKGTLSTKRASLPQSDF